jgi:hypothetical protein
VCSSWYLMHSENMFLTRCIFSVQVWPRDKAPSLALSRSKTHSWVTISTCLISCDAVWLRKSAPWAASRINEYLTSYGFLPCPKKLTPPPPTGVPTGGPTVLDPSLVTVPPELTQVVKRTTPELRLMNRHLGFYITVAGGSSRLGCDVETRVFRVHLATILLPTDVISSKCS